MPQSISKKRPWLAALLATFATGLGHLYLRRWRRALGWLAVSLGVTALFTDPAAVDEFLTGSWNFDVLLAIAPMFIVVGCSIVDAYLLAHIQNANARSSEPSDGDLVSCPHCGNELDPDLEFCHWCTRSVDGTDRDQREA
ncbi:zinc ribbon domain-containing protein [Natrinema sp. SYSU A 869]|uniref:zinc ribbon domain-containing protein n=1 Tax=Natrinema sp. SYSU A 869 TaxID=2871694 RepID=UPI001CA441A4|nr:zinc ribbon domain-containing protein [Natrinema sp. SYSU A 869]